MSLLVNKFLKRNLLEQRILDKGAERDRKRQEFIDKSVQDRKAYLCLTPTEQYILNDKSLHNSRQEQRIYDFKTPFDNEIVSDNKSTRPKEMTLTLAVSSIKQSTSRLPQARQQKKKLTVLEQLVFSPDGNIKIMWDFMCMFLIFYEILSIPFVISFDLDISTELSTAITILFLIDIAVTFNTAVWIKGTINYKYSVIFKQYLKLWFWLDLSASFPYDMIVDAIVMDESTTTDSSTGTTGTSSSKTLKQSTQILRLLRFFRFIKVIRLLRLAKLKVIFDKIEEKLQTYTTINTIVSFLKLSFFVLFWSHWLGCIFHFVGQSEDSNNNWLVTAGIYDSPVEVRYVTSIYWAVTTMITVGYGDVSPQTPIERLFGVFFLLVACGVLSFTMNSIGNTMQQMSQKKDQQKKNIAEINNYMQKVKIPKHLQQRVRKYLQYIWDSSRLIKLDAITANLSQELKQLLTVHVNGNILASYSSFCKTFSRVLLLDITQILFEQTAQPDEYIIIEDSPKNLNHMYFIQDGIINIVMPRTRQVIAKLANKQIFGEINFFANVGRTASAKSEGFSDLFVLRREDFLQLLVKYPKDWEKFYYIQEEVNRKQFQVLQIHCYACELPGHVVRDCPQLHFVVDLYIYNKTKDKCIKAIMKEYVRKDRTHYNALRHNQIVRREALSIQTVLPMTGYIVEECNLDESQMKAIQFKSIPQTFNIKSKFREDRKRRKEIQKVMRNQQIQVQAINQRQQNIYELTKSLTNVLGGSTPSINLQTSSMSKQQIEKLSSDEESESETIRLRLDEIVFEYQVQKEHQAQENQALSNKSNANYQLIDYFECGYDFERYYSHNNLSVVLKEVQKFYNGAQIKPKIDTDYDANVFQEYMEYYAINMHDINRFKLEVKPERLKQFLPYTTLLEMKQSRQFKQSTGLIKKPKRQAKQVVNAFLAINQFKQA